MMSLKVQKTSCPEVDRYLGKHVQKFNTYIRPITMAIIRNTEEICHHLLYCRKLINFHFSLNNTTAGLILIYCLDLPMSNCK